MSCVLAAALRQPNQQYTRDVPFGNEPVGWTGASFSLIAEAIFISVIFNFPDEKMSQPDSAKEKMKRADSATIKKFLTVISEPFVSF